MLHKDTLEPSLLDAVQAKQYDAAESMLKNGATGIAGPDGNSALHIAVNNNDTKMIVLLLKYNTDPSLKNTAKQNPVVLAAVKGFLNCVITFAESKKEITVGFEFGKYEYGRALLHCVHANHDKSVCALLKAGAVPKWHFADTNENALHLAVRNNNTDMIALLIANGAELCAINKAKETPAVLAAKLEHWNCIMKIARSKKEDFNGDIHGKYQYGNALLMCAKANRYMPVRELLLANAKSNWAFTDKLTTPLHHAAINNSPAMAALLITNNADPNCKTTEGLTPLKITTNNKFWDCTVAINEPKRYLIKDIFSEVQLSLIYLFSAQQTPGNPFAFLNMDALKIVLDYAFGHLPTDIYLFNDARLKFVDLRPDRKFICSATLFVKAHNSPLAGIFQAINYESRESAEFAQSLQNIISSDKPLNIRANTARAAISLFVQDKANVQSRAGKILKEYNLMPILPAPK